MKGASNGDQSHILFGVILDVQVDNVAFSVDHVWESRRSVHLRILDEVTYVRPKGLSEEKEPVTFSSSSTSGSGSATVSSATIRG